MELISIADDKIDCRIMREDKFMIIKGYLKNPSMYKTKVIIAPNPPDIRTSYSGTALPFPCEEIALEKTKNFYEIGNDGVIDIKFLFPNSYYNPEATIKIKSPFLLFIDNNKFVYETVDLCPLKTLRDRVRGNPSFYAIKEVLLPVADAEDTMINYSNAKSKYNIA
jgi:hypothetical protein